jgi:general stress protein 26
MPDDDRRDEVNRDHTLRLAELIESVRYAMVTSRAADGSLRARPLTTLKVERSGGLVFEFVIDAGSELASEVSADPQINLAYANPPKDIYATVSAEAHLSEDLVRKRKLWNAMSRPGSRADPTIRPACCSWRSCAVPSTGMSLRAAARGTQPTLDAEHGKVDAA